MFKIASPTLDLYATVTDAKDHVAVEVFKRAKYLPRSLGTVRADVPLHAALDAVFARLNDCLPAGTHRLDAVIEHLERGTFFQDIQP